MISDGIKTSFIQFILCLFFLFCYVKQVHSDTFKILIPEDVKRDYIHFLDGRDPLTIKDFSSPYARRDVVEVNLLIQALFLGGNNKDYELLTSYTANSHIQLLTRGNVDLIGTSVWKNMFAPSSVLFSHAIIKHGQFEAGLYTSPTNHQMLFTRTKQQLKKRSAISNRNWTVDWQTLPELQLQRIWYTDKWSDMVEMVYQQRVDFLLAPFQANPEMAINLNGMKLIPVRGVKVALAGSRHFAISKQSPYATQLVEQLNLGLQKLAEQQLISKAYSQSGFYHPAVKTWQKLN